MLKDVLTVQDVATEKDVDEQTVRHWIATKQLLAFDACRNPGGPKPRWRIHREHLDAFWATRGNRPATQPTTTTTTKPRRKQVATAKQWV